MSAYLKLPVNTVFHAFDVQQAPDMLVYMAVAVEAPNQKSDLLVLQPFFTNNLNNLTILPIQQVDQVSAISIVSLVHYIDVSNH